MRAGAPRPPALRAGAGAGAGEAAASAQLAARREVGRAAARHVAAGPLAAIGSRGSERRDQPEAAPELRAINARQVRRRASAAGAARAGGAILDAVVTWSAVAPLRRGSVSGSVGGRRSASLRRAEVDQTAASARPGPRGPAPPPAPAPAPPRSRRTRWMRRLTLAPRQSWKRCVREAVRIGVRCQRPRHSSSRGSARRSSRRGLSRRAAGGLSTGAAPPRGDRGGSSGRRAR